MKCIKIISYLGWASGLFGALLMLGGVIGFFLSSEFLGVRNFYNFFFVANSFLFLGMFLLIGCRCYYACKHIDEKCCTEEEKAK